jgi:hypothetical protein
MRTFLVFLSKKNIKISHGYKLVLFYILYAKLKKIIVSKGSNE